MLCRSLWSSITLSLGIWSANIALRVPFLFTKPHCSSDTLSCILQRIWFTITFKIIFSAGSLCWVFDVYCTPKYKGIDVLLKIWALTFILGSVQCCITYLLSLLDTRLLFRMLLQTIPLNIRFVPQNLKISEMTEAIKRNKIKNIKWRHRNVFLAILVGEPHCQEWKT